MLLSLITALCILPVTVVSGGKEFLRLKLIETLSRSHERLTGLAILSIEQDIVEKLNFSIKKEEK